MIYRKYKTMVEQKDVYETQIIDELCEEKIDPIYPVIKNARRFVASDEAKRLLGGQELTYYNDDEDILINFPEGDEISKITNNYAQTSDEVSKCKELETLVDGELDEDYTFCKFVPMEEGSDKKCDKGIISIVEEYRNKVDQMPDTLPECYNTEEMTDEEIFAAKYELYNRRFHDASQEDLKKRFDTKTVDQICKEMNAVGVTSELFDVPEIKDLLKQQFGIEIPEEKEEVKEPVTTKAVPVSFSLETLKKEIIQELKEEIKKELKEELKEELKKKIMEDLLK